MAKTKQTGVRFDKDLLEILKKDYDIPSPQKALNFLTGFFLMNRDKKIDVKKIFENSSISTKKPDKKAETPAAATPIQKVNAKFQREAIFKQIETIKSEQLPEQRNTILGRKSWALEQNNRIAELKKQLQ